MKIGRDYVYPMWVKMWNHQIEKTGAMYFQWDQVPRFESTIP